jgi:hypothetical protein
MGFSEVRGLSVSVVVREETVEDELGPSGRESGPERSEWWHWGDWFDRLERATRAPPPPRRETHSPPLELRRGVTDDASLRAWLQGWVDGDVGPRDVRVCLLGSDGDPVRGWVCRAATPVRWSGPEFVAERAAVATESLELTHEGVDAVADLAECCDRGGDHP